MLKIACLVDIGMRLYNDDRVLINEKLISDGKYSDSTISSCLVAVCDGVGGNKYGHEAAEIALDTFSKIKIKAFPPPLLDRDILENSIKQANEAVIKAQRKDKNHSKMATTIAGLYINENDFIAFNVGDSRVYRYRTPYIMQLSTDHAYQEYNNILTRYLGGNLSKPAIVEGQDRVFENDIFVLCTDGVWGALSNEDFENIITNENDLPQMCKNLVTLAKGKGSTDNLSVIIVKKY